MKALRTGGFFILFSLMTNQAWSNTTSVAVTTALPKITTLVETTESITNLQTRHAPFVSAQVAGKVVSLKVDVGTKVKKGQLLAKLEDIDYQLAKQAAESDIQGLRALLKAQKLTLKRLNALLKNNATTQDKVDQAQAQYDATLAKISAAQVRLAQAKRKIDLCLIKSPIDGQVAQRNITYGDFVALGKPLFKIVDTKNVRTVFPFPEYLAPRIHPGQKIYLKTNYKQETLETRVKRIEPQVKNQSIQILADFTNHKNWPIGTSVQGQLVLQEKPLAIMVPQEAVVERQGHKVVFILEGDRAKAVSVQTGLAKGGEVEITQGLDRKTPIIVKGAGFLTDGSQVKVH